MNTTDTAAYRIISNHEFAEVRQKLFNNQNALFTLKAWRPGEVIADFSAGTISSEPTYLTVQLAVGKHITLRPEFLQYINHSCDPNVFFDTALLQVVALRPIQAGEEFVFFYPSSEWKMTQSFHCYCGSPRCLGEIRGAAFLPKEIIHQYRFTDYIQLQLAEVNKAKKIA